MAGGRQGMNHGKAGAGFGFGFGSRPVVSPNQRLNHSTWRLCEVIELGVLGIKARKER